MTRTTDQSMRLLGKGILGLYGLTTATKTIELWDAKVRVWDRDSNQSRVVPMLVGDKISVLLLSLIMAPIALPVSMCSYLNSMDMYLRGKTRKDFGLKEKETYHDYIF